MFDFIKNLQEKPEHHRRAITLISSLFISLVIFVVWLSVIFPTSVQTEKKLAESESSRNAGLMDVFSRNVASVSSAFKDQLLSIKDITKLFTTVYTADTEVDIEIEAPDSEDKSQ